MDDNSPIQTPLFESNIRQLIKYIVLLRAPEIIYLRPTSWPNAQPVIALSPSNDHKDAFGASF
jgi:hypothetical protein